MQDKIFVGCFNCQPWAWWRLSIVYNCSVGM